MRHRFSRLFNVHVFIVDEYFMRSCKFVNFFGFNEKTEKCIVTKAPKIISPLVLYFFEEQKLLCGQVREVSLYISKII